MTAIWLIARRELGAYLRTWSGYIIAAAALLIQGILWNAIALGTEHNRLSSEVLFWFFWVSSGVVMTAAVLLSMRLLAEERQLGTLVLLASSPVHERDIVLGKFFSALAFLVLMTAPSIFMPLLIMVNGKLSFGHVAAGYLGLFLLGSASLAIGTLGSALAHLAPALPTLRVRPHPPARRRLLPGAHLLRPLPVHPGAGGTAMALAHSKIPSVAYATGLCAIYLGQRVVEPGRTARSPRRFDTELFASARLFASTTPTGSGPMRASREDFGG